MLIVAASAALAFKRPRRVGARMNVSPRFCVAQGHEEQSASAMPNVHILVLSLNYNILHKQQGHSPQPNQRMCT
jgi:hypothetical protein